MADDSLSSTAPEGTEGEQNESKLSVGETSDGVSARKTGENEVTLDIKVPNQGGGIMRKITRAARGPMAAASMAAASAAAPAIEPVDIFDEPSAKHERLAPQKLPDDLPQEGRDFSLPKQPTSIYNDDQDAAAADLQKDKAKDPYAASDDGLALKDADIGQGNSSDPQAGGIAAIDANGDTTPPTISPDQQADSAATDVARNQAETTQTQKVSQATEATAKGENKIDLSRGNHAAIISTIPGVSTLIDKADDLVKKEPKKAAKIYGRLAFTTKNYERFSAIKNIVQFIIFTSESIVIPLILIVLSPILVPIFLTIIIIAPQWLSPDTQEIHELTEFLEEREKKAEARHKQMQSAKKALAQQNRFNGNAIPSQPPPSPN